jgi:hypothetical protein
VYGDNANNNPENHPQNKWYDIKPTPGGKAVAYLIIYILFVVIDAHDIYPWRHDVALAAGALATIAVLYAEGFAVDVINSRVWLGTSGLIIAITFCLNLYVGPNLPEETETAGWLPPGNDPPIKTLCPLPPDGLAFVAGRNVAGGPSKNGAFLVLQLNQTPLIAVVKDGNKLAFDADVYDEKGLLAVRVEKNKFLLIQGEYSYEEDRDTDRSNLLVYDKHGKPLLRIKYANNNTIYISGVFYSEDVAQAIITDDSIAVHEPNVGATFSFSRSCIIGGLFIHKTLGGAVVIGG